MLQTKLMLKNFFSLQWNEILAHWNTRDTSDKTKKVLDERWATLKDDLVAFHCSKSKSQVAAVVSYVFILSYMANPASFLVLVCFKLFYGDNTFYIHFCHVTLECPKPRPL